MDTYVEEGLTDEPPCLSTAPSWITLPTPALRRLTVPAVPAVPTAPTSPKLRALHVARAVPITISTSPPAPTLPASSGSPRATLSARCAPAVPAVVRLASAGQLLQYTTHVAVVQPGQALQLVAQRQGGGVSVNPRPTKSMPAPRPPWQVRMMGHIRMGL